MPTLAQTWQRLTHDDRLLLFLLAVTVGAAGGYRAVAFEPDRAEPVTARDLVHRTPVALAARAELRRMGIAPALST